MDISLRVSVHFLLEKRRHKYDKTRPYFASFFWTIVIYRCTAEC